MSSCTTVQLGLTANASLPRCFMGGTDESIPLMEWKDEHYNTFEVVFARLDDPAAYLRDLAHALTALAHEVDQGRDRQPTGYAAPVVGATS